MLKAVIDSVSCVGCTRCVDFCPVDAIVGANGQLHGVLVDECIGCKLCLPPCPVDCITMEENPSVDKQQRALRAKQRYLNRQQRLSSKLSLPEINDKDKKTTVRNNIKRAIDEARRS